MGNEAIIKKAADIMAGNTGEFSKCVISQIDSEGYPTAATVTASKCEGIKRIYFCSGLQSNKAKRAELNDKTSVCFNSDEYNITLTGRLKVDTDSELKKEMWYGGLKNHFSGPEDPDYCVLVFESDTYNLLIDWQEIRGSIS